MPNVTHLIHMLIAYGYCRKFLSLLRIKSTLGIQLFGEGKGSECDDIDYY